MKQNEAYFRAKKGANQCKKNINVNKGKLYFIHTERIIMGQGPEEDLKKVEEWEVNKRSDTAYLTDYKQDNDTAELEKSRN